MLNIGATGSVVKVNNGNVSTCGLMVMLIAGKWACWVMEIMVHGDAR